MLAATPIFYGDEVKWKFYVKLLFIIFEFWHHINLPILHIRDYTRFWVAPRMNPSSVPHFRWIAISFCQWTVRLDSKEYNREWDTFLFLYVWIYCLFLVLFACMWCIFVHCKIQPLRQPMNAALMSKKQFF